MKPFQEATVAILGLGLMGGSLAAALRAKRSVGRVIGVARRAETIEEAVALGFIDEGTRDAATGIADADLVVLATPVQTTLTLLQELAPRFRAGSVVSDVGSTKADVVAAMSSLPPGVHPIGGHPMCGKEAAGLSAAEPDLFEGKVYVLTPLERTPPEATQTMQSLAEAVGARCVIVDAARHDRLVAAISHLPYVVAACLVAAAEDAGPDPLIWELAASGFRDTSRLAASETTMMRDILLTNHTNVLDLIDLFGRRLAEMRADLQDAARGNGADELTRFMSDVRRRREELFR